MGCAQKTGNGCNIVTLDKIDNTLESYGQFSRWAGGVDGIIEDSVLISKANPLLLQAIRDCNVPVAPKGEIEEKARLYRHAKNLMDGILSIDTHCDFPEQIYYHPEAGNDVGASRAPSQVSIEKMRQGHVAAEYMVVWIDPRYSNRLKAETMGSRPDVMWDFTDSMLGHFAQYGSECGIAACREDALRLKSEGKKAFFLCLENGYWIGNDLSQIQKLRDRGFTYITLSHWGDNQICHSSDRSEDPSKGLTDFGKDVVREMNRVGMVIDLSHTSYGTWREVLSLSRKPVVFSHSGAAAIYNHPRNVDDGTLLLLKKNGGVIQVPLVLSFLADKGKRDGVGIDEMLDHICHIVDLIGIDHVGIGLDFDGGGGGKGLNGINDAVNLTMALIQRGFSDGDIEKIWGGNYFRVLEEVQKPLDEDFGRFVPMALSDPFIVVSKASCELALLNSKGEVVKRCACACARNIGPKQVRGDNKTPEGIFKINELLFAKNIPHDFHDGKGPILGAYGPWFLRLDVPGFRDIGIHGTHLPESIGSRASEGCIRVRNEDILEIKSLVKVGTTVIILPEGERF